MRVFEAEHYYKDEPEDLHNVLVGLMTRREMDVEDSIEDEDERDKYIRHLTHDTYGDNDFIFYFCEDDFANDETFNVGEIINDVDQVFKLLWEDKEMKGE